MRAYTYPGPGLWCALNALTCATLPRDGVLDVLLSADNVWVCCWHAAGVLASLQALWLAPARGQVRWDGDAACLEEAAHLFGFIIRAMLRCLRNTVRVEKLRAHATWLGRTAMQSRVHAGVAKAAFGAGGAWSLAGLTVPLLSLE